MTEIKSALSFQFQFTQYANKTQTFERGGGGCVKDNILDTNTKKLFYDDIILI